MAVSGLSGCGTMDPFEMLIGSSYLLHTLADVMAVSLLGDDPFTWNVLSIKPEESYGYERNPDPKWYTYTATTKSDIESGRTALDQINNQFKRIKLSALGERDAAIYRALEYRLKTYVDYYSSPYAADFTLIGGSCIDSQGGQVSEFATAVENYAFRTGADVDDLLKLTISTKDAFNSYIYYVKAREDAGYPLYNYTVSAMQEYLDDVYAQGDRYYLYSVIENKIDGSSFLTADEKASYKTRYVSALTDKFMPGVKALSDGLEQYKDDTQTVEKSYLASYGEAGKAYYRWLFENSTGVRNVDLQTLYNSVAFGYGDYLAEYTSVSDEIKELEQSNPTLYAEMQEYITGKKLLLGLNTPQAALDYLKVAADNIVPALETEPEIDFKYMDDTVSQRTNTLAYYLLSPYDESNSVEHITINPYAIENDPSDLLTVIAHEGYPGHLYAHVHEKQNQSSMINMVSKCISFSEGWATYVMLVLLDNIKAASTDAATKLYARYKYYEIVTRYVSSFLFDLRINYFGSTVSELVADGLEYNQANNIVNTLMEVPAQFVSYGYGVYVMLELHARAKVALGNAYSETEINRRLLAEGEGPTLARAREIVSAYINEK